MEIKKLMASLALALAVATGANADVLRLNLDSCRALALQNNNELKMQDAKKQKAYYDRKAALTKFFPRVNLMGAYMFTSRQIELLSEENKDKLSNIGTTASGKIDETMAGAKGKLTESLTNYVKEGMESGGLAEAAQRLQRVQFVSDLLTPLEGATGGVAPALNNVGSNLVSDLETDTRNIGIIAAMLTQPIYMGGKICAYYNITKRLEELSNIQTDGKQTDIIVETDEAYWRVVSLVAKKKLAQSYLNTVDTLNKNVDKLIAAGFATKADGLNVKVKLNEAKVSIIQVENGITLSKMLLCQICGLDLNTEIELADENLDESAFVEPQDTTEAAVEKAVANRHELRSLEIANEIGQYKVKIARSEFLPNVVLTGGYLTTYPSCFDGFQTQFGGMWTVGVMAKIPVITCGERIFKVRAAKAEAKITEYKYDEAKEKITLQVNQNKQKLSEAAERLVVARTGKVEAEENLRYAQLGLKEGMIPVADVLRAETALLNAQTALIEAQIDMMLADVYLRKTLGGVR